MQFEPITDPDQVRVIIAEDGEEISKQLAIAVKYFLGIQDVLRFDELYKAAEYFDGELKDETGKKIPYPKEKVHVAILDNYTPDSYPGIYLAYELLEEREKNPNLYVVALSSTDPYLVDSPDMLDRLRKGGGEFFVKEEKNSMVTLIGECLKRGEFIERVDFLRERGIKENYPDRYDTKVHSDYEIELLGIVSKIERAKDETEANRVLQKAGIEIGDFLRKNTLEVKRILMKEGQINQENEQNGAWIERE